MVTGKRWFNTFLCCTASNLRRKSKHSARIIGRTGYKLCKYGYAIAVHHLQTCLYNHQALQLFAGLGGKICPKQRIYSFTSFFTIFSPVASLIKLSR